MQARHKWGPGEARAPHFLSDQLTLSQPGGHIIPTQYYVPPRFSDLATALPGDAGAKALLGSAIFPVDIQNVRFI